MNSMKINRGRSKIFKCFQAPVVDEDEGDCESAGSGESSASGDGEGGWKRKKIVRSRVCVVLKDVFLPPLRKCRSENCKRQLYRLKSNLSTTSEKFVRSMKKINIPAHKVFRDADEFFRIYSICRLSLFSTSSHSSTCRTTTSSPATSRCDSSLFSSNSMPIKSSSMGPETFTIRRSTSLDLGHLRPINKVRNSLKRSNNINKPCNHHHRHKPTLEMCSLVVYLLALLIWGKVFAILTCTSTWLLFAPDRRGRRYVDRAKFSENDAVRVGGGDDMGGGQAGLLE